MSDFARRQACTKTEKFQVRKEIVRFGYLRASIRFFMTIFRRSADYKDASYERTAPIE